MPPKAKTFPVCSGRCYCGASVFSTSAKPLSVCYCHCTDCRRWTGGPVAAFAAFRPADIVFKPALGAAFSCVEGVDRWTCPNCASPLAARFDYLPDQVFIPVGIVDEAEAMKPQRHCHSSAALSWLPPDDSIPKHEGSGRDGLSEAALD